MRGWPVLAYMLLAACARPLADPPPAHPPFLAIAASASPPPSPDLDPDEGTVEIADLCPDEPAGAAHGCGTDDDILVGDRCPGQPETLNDFEDEDGCPDADPPHVARLHALAREVKFPPAKGSLARAVRIDARAARALREVAEILHDHPHLALRIAGHADSRDDRGVARVGVSGLRADSIQRFLIDQGVDPHRLEARGYGPDLPVDTNATPAGRANNRRITFLLVRSTPPKSVEELLP